MLAPVPRSAPNSVETVTVLTRFFLLALVLWYVEKRIGNVNHLTFSHQVDCKYVGIPSLRRVLRPARYVLSLVWEDVCRPRDAPLV